MQDQDLLQLENYLINEIRSGRMTYDGAMAYLNTPRNPEDGPKSDFTNPFALKEYMSEAQRLALENTLLDEFLRIMG